MVRKMETYHEGTSRCSRVGHADCRPDVRSVRERGPCVPGELLIRVQRLLTEDAPISDPKVSDRDQSHDLLYLQSGRPWPARKVEAQSCPDAFPGIVRHDGATDGQ